MSHKFIGEYSKVALCAVITFALQCVSCSVGGKGGGSDRSPAETGPTPGATPTPAPNPNNYPPPSIIKEEAGFFVEVLGEAKDRLNMHQDLTTFDEPCRINGTEKIINCYVEGEEATFFTQSFSLHYHAPPSLCTYIVTDPFYFVNRKTKWQTTTIDVSIDKFGIAGVDSDSDGDVDSDFGCYTNGNEPTCCIGKYFETSRTWLKDINAYSTTSVRTVDRSAAACLGGPATKTQPISLRGFPQATFEFIQGVGTSKEYNIESTASHGIPPAWNLNFYDKADHGGTLPEAFSANIGLTDNIGNPYYSFICTDSAFEVIAQINITLREWNTKAAYDARKTAPTAHDEVGAEPDPFSSHDKNDWNDWKDFEAATIKFPGLEYK
ncbi:MAG: hypothetical protein NT027_05340 [Proteobacteria bacterium]|nr:hypothetical protein [Pseudomonadota bacterium]